jgi:hypothetical protein
LNAPNHKRNWHALVIGPSTTTGVALRIPQFLSTVSDLSLHTLPSVSDAINAIVSGRLTPDLLIVLQAWPEQHPPAECEQLLKLAPLARCICCCSPWCESEGRNCDTWPLAIRVPMDAAVWRLRHEIRVLKNIDRPLPITAGRDETFAFHTHPSPPAARASSVGIHTEDLELRRAFMHMLRADGWTTPVSGADVILLDIDPWDESTRRWGCTIQDTAPGTPIVGWSYWPHHIPDTAGPSASLDGNLNLVAVAPKLCPIGQLTDLLHRHACGAQATTNCVT